MAAAIAAQQYSGDIGVLSSDADLSDTNYFPQARKSMGYSGDYAILLLGFNGASGDTITASVGTLRQSAVGAAGAAGVAIVDNTQTAVANLLGQVRLNNSREWGAIPVGLQATGTAFPSRSYEGRLPITRAFGSKEPVSLSARMPLGGGGGILPPSDDGQIFPPSTLLGLS